MQTKTCLLQKSGKIHLNEFSLITDLVYMDTIRTQEYAILPSTYF